MKKTAQIDGRPATLDTETGEVRPIDNQHSGVIATYWKTPYNHDVDAEAARTATEFHDPSKTQQHFRDETDINIIVSRVMKTGQLPDIKPLQYADLTTQEDYHTMLTRVAEANGMFYKLDPELRAEYNNDPGAWLQDVNEKIAKGDLEPLREMGMDMTSVDAQIKAIETKQAEERQAEAEAAVAAKASQAASTAAKT